MSRMVVVGMLALLCCGCRSHHDLLIVGTFPNGQQLTLRAHAKKGAITGVGRLVSPTGAALNLKVISGTATGKTSASVTGVVQGTPSTFTIQAITATGQITLTLTTPGAKTPTTTTTTRGAVIFK